MQPLQQLTPLKQLKHLEREHKERVSYLSSIEAFLYSANICYYAHRLLNNEIKVHNREIVLSGLMQEMVKMRKLLSEDYTADNAITTKERRETFKRLKITKKRIEHKN